MENFEKYSFCAGAGGQGLKVWGFFGWAVVFILPVLLQGHQEPSELAVHFPNFWHLDQLPFALAGELHPADSPDTAGWQPHGVLCCHCKPGKDKVRP